MRVCIIGINGLLGQNLFWEAPQGVEIWGAGLESAPLLSQVGRERYQQLDLTDLSSIAPYIARCKADWVVNVAAMTAVDLCEKEIELCQKINRDAPAVMAQHAGRLLHISTDYVFDGENGPYSETDATSPLSVYGQSKLESERAVLSASTDHVIVRTMTLYGAGVGIRPSFVDWIKNELQAGHRVPVVTDQIGNPTLASNLAHNIWALIAADGKGIYNIADEERCSRFEWAEAIAQKMGLDSNLLRPVTTAELKQPAPRPLSSGLRLEKIAKIPHVRIESIDAQLCRYQEDLNRATI